MGWLQECDIDEESQPATQIVLNEESEASDQTVEQEQVEKLTLNFSIE